MVTAAGGNFRGGEGVLLEQRLRDAAGDRDEIYIYIYIHIYIYILACICYQYMSMSELHVRVLLSVHQSTFQKSIR